MYNFSDIIKYGLPAPANSLAFEYQKRATPESKHGTIEYTNPKKKGYVDLTALAEVVQIPECAKHASSDNLVHLRLGDAMFRNDPHLHTIDPEILHKLVSSKFDDHTVQFFSGVHNQIGIEESNQYMQKLSNLAPNAKFVFDRGANDVSKVDADFCNMVHSQNFIKAKGGFSERVAQARCQLNLPSYEIYTPECLGARYDACTLDVHNTYLQEFEC